MTRNLKCVIVGDGAVGKTCMLMSYSCNCFPDEYIPTVFDNYNATIQYGPTQKLISLGLWDTAGQQDYDRLRPLSYPNTIVDPESLENVKGKWFPEIKNYFGSEDIEELCPPLILVGTKTDLRNDVKTLKELKLDGHCPLTSDDGERMKVELGLQEYVECSSKTQVGLKEVFEASIDSVFERESFREIKNRKRKCTIL